MADVEISTSGAKRLIALKYERDPKPGTRGKPDPSRVRVRDLLRLLCQTARQVPVRISHSDAAMEGRRYQPGRMVCPPQAQAVARMSYATSTAFAT
jgi:hypothetical protein